MADHTGTPRPRAQATEPIAIGLTPVATVARLPNDAEHRPSPVLDLDGWSPRGDWLAYWTADGSDHYAYWRWPGTLHVLDTRSGRSCVQPEVRRTTHADGVFWTTDGQVAVRTEGRVVQGRPCHPLTPAPESSFALPAAPPGETPAWAEPSPHEGWDSPGPEDSVTSRDGKHVATTVKASDQPEELAFTTRITRAADGALEAEATWQSLGGIGDMGTGGDWLPSGDFLVATSVDRGPLLIRPDGTVSELAPERFGVPKPVNPASIGPHLRATLVISPDGQSWHLFLTGGDGSAMLYHPESESVETLPSTSIWNPPVSPDGRWILLVGRYGRAGRSEALFVRGLEDDAAEFRRIPGGGHGVAYHTQASPDWSMLAIVDPEPGTVDIVRFPGLQPIGRWLTGYQVGSTRWSPDGRLLAVDGHHGGGEIVERALFLISVPAAGAP